jgi:hypothetical protein
MSRIFKRKEGTVSFSASSQERLELSRTAHVQYLMLKLKINHTNGTTPVLNDAKLWALINSVEVVANGNENIKQIPASKLYLDNIIASGMNGLNEVNLTASSTVESYAYAMIPFSVPNSVRPHDTIINTRLFSTFDLLVNWGSSATLGSDITVNSASIEVSSGALVGYSRNAGETIKYFKETSLMKEVTSSTNEMTISLPVEKLYKAISVVATHDGLRTNDIINNIIVKSGETVFLNWDAETIRALNNLKFKPETTSGLDGIMVIEFDERGMLSDMLNTVTSQGGFNTLEVVLDVTKSATGTDRVYLLSDTIQNTGIVEVKA